jgi:ribosomal protein S18 acetylase RimI-like enzyme
MSLAELPKRILEIDISEHGAVVYYWINGELKALPEEWDRPQWTTESMRQGSWITVLNMLGVKAWGAFDNDRLVGVVVYRPRLSEKMAQLAALFVSKDYRRQWIAERLTRAVSHQAQLDGHVQLYVSATPSESAVNFYSRQGFVPTEEANAELYALEPDDIHMVKEL